MKGSGNLPQTCRSRDMGTDQRHRFGLATTSDLKNRNEETGAALAAKETALKASTAREGGLLERISKHSRTEGKRIAREAAKRFEEIE